jgi:hypothetical protein
MWTRIVLYRIYGKMIRSNNSSIPEGLKSVEFGPLQTRYIFEKWPWNTKNNRLYIRGFQHKKLSLKRHKRKD